MSGKHERKTITMPMNKLYLHSFFSLLLLIFLFSCSKRESAPLKSNSPKRKLFELLHSSQTGVGFNNKLIESDSVNILRQANLYNGGGVGIGDFNNDGLKDIYFAGNQVSNKLYLNKGKNDDMKAQLKYEDVTEAAGVAGANRWCTGVAVVDINADGWLDIYVSASFYENAERRTNLLYINRGVNDRGIPTFEERAEAYGLADDGFSTQGVFFDYDKDGDLDMYLLTNQIIDPKTPIKYRPKVTDGTALNTDRLFRNNGDETFTDVSKAAGVTIEGWGHAVGISDFNLDGWPDIYVSNDFVSNDLLYINNKDGTFSNRAGDYMKHSAWNAMGTEIADINNDGFVDLISLEMLPEKNLRKKTTLGGNEYYNYYNNTKYAYDHQYVRNVLQLNSGNAAGEHPMFSDIAFMAEVYQTDWSWGPLVADFDNDGLRDIIITNGLPRDVTDLDYIVYDNGQGNYGGKTDASLEMVEKYFPIVKSSNYAFKNSNGLMFADSTKSWGLHIPSFSNGGTYSDLDNDGDLDLVVNNINDPAFIYQNTLNDAAGQTPVSYLSVLLEGSLPNTGATGAKVSVYYAGSHQVYEHYPIRGYLSTTDNRAHFGLGEVQVIDSLRVDWPDGRSQLLQQVKVNQTIQLVHRDASSSAVHPQYPKRESYLEDVASKYGIQYRHEEKDAIDYNIQPTLPHKLSQYGPGIAVGDVDNNGYDDFYIGGPAGQAGVFFMQDANGRFTKDSRRFLGGEKPSEEDIGMLLFDADNDSDLDLYVVSGSYELPPGHPTSQDRLYINDGRGRFRRDANALPKELSNGSCVRAADFDSDGDLDLFVGGRSVSGKYPVAPESYLLENQAGTFVDATQKYCPALQRLGMITDALWSDYDLDGKVDLVLVGEWMPVTFLKNNGHGFTIDRTNGIDAYRGWWNSLVAGDFDNDGDIDFAAGNLGLNSSFKATTEEPMTILAKDIDGNEKIDAMVFCYMKAEDDTRKPFPIHTRDDLIRQSISIRRKYPTYKSYGMATMNDMWGLEERRDAIMMTANYLNSAYIENLGGGKFDIRSLPLEAQLAPIYGMMSLDVDGDGHLDLLMAGNDYGIEPIAGRHDAFMGLCLKGDGKGNFTKMKTAESGFLVKGDAKAMVRLQSASGQHLVLTSQNQDILRVHELKRAKNTGKTRQVSLNAGDFYAEVLCKDRSKRRIEFYYGSTFLSQSARTLAIDENMAEVTIVDFKGDKRKVL